MAKAHGDQRWCAAVKRAFRNQLSTVRNIVVLVTLPAFVVAITYLFDTALSLFAVTAVLTGTGVVALIAIDMLVHRWAHHRGVDLQRAEWNRLVTTSIARTGTSEAALIGDLRLSRLRWFLWRHGWSDPDPRAQGSLAEHLGLEGVELLSSVGYMERGAARRLVRVDRSEDKAAIVAFTTWRAAAERAIQLDTVSGGGRLAGALDASIGRDASAPIRAIVSPVARGREFRIPMFEEYVAFIPAAPGGAAFHALREQIERRVEPWWQHTAASWEDSTDLINESFKTLITSEALDAAQVAIVPGLLATTVRDHAHEPGRPNQVVVVGDHHSGAADVAGLIAAALGASFALLSNLAVERFGKVEARPGERGGASVRTRHEMTLASALMGNAREGKDPAENYVWAYNDREAIQRQAIDLADSEVDLIVCLRSSEELLRYNAGRAYLVEKQRQPDLPPARFEELLKERRPLQDAIQAINDRRLGRNVILHTVAPPSHTRVELGMPHPSVREDAYIDDVDAFFDEYARYARAISETIEGQLW